MDLEDIWIENMQSEEQRKNWNEKKNTKNKASEKCRTSSDTPEYIQWGSQKDRKRERSIKSFEEQFLL